MENKQENTVKTKIATKSATMDTRELRESLQRVNCIPRHRELTVLTPAMIEFAHRKAIITTTDLERVIKTEINSTNSEDFSILLPRKTTEKFLTGNNGKVSITQDDNHQLSTLCRDGIGDLNLITPAITDFPPLPPMPDNLEWHSIDSKWFCSMLRIVSTACASELSRPVLSGVAFNDGKIAAADGFRLIVFRDNRLAFGLDEKQAIIPLETTILMNKLFRKEETIEISFKSKEETSLGTTRVTPTNVYFKSGNTLMSSTLIQGNYPAYEKLIPDQFNCKASFSAPLLAQRLKMIDDVAINSGIIRYIFETSELGEQVCSLSATIEDESKYHLSCPVKFEGSEVKIAFNYKYVMEALKPFSMCALEITAPSAPGKLTGDIEGLIVVIMPMFVQW